METSSRTTTPNESGRSVRSRFPSLRIFADRFEAQGTFALAQASYLEPDPDAVRALERELRARNLGVVAHFYMDAELQGVLAACDWPHIFIADSLQMAERALSMAKAGVRAIVVLGVDFMSENVRATLDANGCRHVPVYRVQERAIGCSLAESAEARAYGAYLARAAKTPRSLHVIYVNTSLAVKARAQALLPTITCTSSNVLSLILQAYAQVPELHVWFGPDTYMGRNLARMLGALAELDAESIRALHPAHSPASLAAASERFHHFEQGLCIVHHMFGDEVVARVRREHADAFVTAHLEVPGEMFALGFEAQRRGRGVVGSTSNILDFIDKTVEHALAERRERPLSFVLGTESGMVTSVARKVQAKLRAARERGLATPPVEIVFPVAAEAIATTHDRELPIVPGVLAGEGCTTAGGCASCPYMKMNSLDALFELLAAVAGTDITPPRSAGAMPPDAGASLAGFSPKTYPETPGSPSVAELGGKSITRMRELQQHGRLPDELVAEICAVRPGA